MRSENLCKFTLGETNLIHSLSSPSFRFCMRMGGHYSHFKPVKRARKAILKLEIAALQLECSRERDQSAIIIFTVLYLKSENF